MARIAETYADKNGIVRSVKLKLGSSNKVDKSVRCLQRPVNKLVMLVEDK